VWSRPQQQFGTRRRKVAGPTMTGRICISSRPWAPPREPAMATAPARTSPSPDPREERYTRSARADEARARRLVGIGAVPSFGVSRQRLVGSVSQKKTTCGISLVCRRECPQVWPSMRGSFVIPANAWFGTVHLAPGIPPLNRHRDLSQPSARPAYVNEAFGWRIGPRPILGVP
jgi:hypothetical protein